MQPKADRVVELLRDLLTNGELQPGERIREASLATRLGMSRSPVREALQRLTNEGLIELLPRRGAFVKAIRDTELRELFEVREALESQAAYLASMRATTDELAELANLLEESRRRIAAHDPNAYSGELDFHWRIGELAGNSKLLEKLREIQLQVRLARTLSAADPKRALGALGEHRIIVAAMQGRDHVGALNAMRDHIRSSCTNSWRIFHAEGVSERATGHP